MQGWLTFCVFLPDTFIPVDFAHFGNFAINNWPFAIAALLADIPVCALLFNNAFCATVYI